MVYNGKKFDLRKMSDSDAKLIIAAKKFRKRNIIDWKSAKAQGYLKGLETWPRYRFGARLATIQIIGRKRVLHRWTDQENKLLLKLSKKYRWYHRTDWNAASFDPEFKKLPKGSHCQLSRQLMVLKRRLKVN